MKKRLAYGLISAFAFAGGLYAMQEDIAKPTITNVFKAVGITSLLVGGMSGVSIALASREDNQFPNDDQYQKLNNL